MALAAIEEQLVIAGPRRPRLARQSALITTASQNATRNGPRSARSRSASARVVRVPSPSCCGAVRTALAGERELIAAYVSSLNECQFCASSHAAFAAVQLDEGMPLVDQVRTNLEAAAVPDKLRALLRIAGAVRQGGQLVISELVDAARAGGASDLEIHDMVLIAAAFYMYNRYVDDLGTFAPDASEACLAKGRRHSDQRLPRQRLK